jgi:hypothetical protein
MGSNLAGNLVDLNNDERKEIDLSKHWLRTCLEKHNTCRMRELPSNPHADAPSSIILPTRLIKIESCLNSIGLIHLVSSLNTPQAPYLTLSHCWGGADIVKLTTSNLSQFHSNIPFSLLPKTFTDAIRITVLLGYSYLWIDSLCIIQDSTTDWLQESSLMGSTYCNSILTLAAVGAHDSHGGCLFDRQQSTLFAVQPRHQRLGVYSTERLERGQPLHKRAWVVQERCMATRTLNFGKHQITWDCLTARASYLEPEMKATNSSLSLKRRFRDLLVEDGFWVQNWWNLIEDYTSCKTTYATDRWEAIRGLATEVGRNRNQKLVHGLWADRLGDELLWATADQLGKRVDIDAPSWSWLSVSAKIENYHAMEAELPDAKLRIPYVGNGMVARVSLYPHVGEPRE